MQRLSYRYNDSYKVNYSFREGENTVVFLHGYLQAEIVWHPFIDILPKEQGIISIDLPGHGETSCFGNNYLNLFCEAINEILIYHKIEKRNLVGHSMGGYMALNYLREFNHKVHSLTLLHSTPLPDTAKRTRNRQREIEIIERGKIHLLLETPFDHLFAPQNRERLATYAHQYSELAQKVTPTAMVESVTTMANKGDFIADCKTAKQPIQLIAGTYDEMLLLSRVTECQQLISNIDYHILENSGHTGFMEEPKKTASLLMRIIKMGQ